MKIIKTKLSRREIETIAVEGVDANWGISFKSHDGKEFHVRSRDGESIEIQCNWPKGIGAISVLPVASNMIRVEIVR